MSIRARSLPIRFALAEPNPVLVKELRARFRGPRAFAALTSFLLLLTAFAWFIYVQATSYSMFGGPYSAGQGAEIGRNILFAVSFIEILFVAFIGPSLTADAISGEVERQTWDLLKATPLSGESILFGKVAAAFGYVLLLALSALPVMSLGFVFGGASLSAVLRMQGSMLTAGLLYLAVGAFWSSLVRRTGRAAILGYLTVGCLMFLPAIMPMLWLMLTGGDSSFPMASENAWWHLFLATSPPMEVFLSMQAGSTAGSGSALPIWTTWAMAMMLRLVIAAFLLLIAGARIRPLGVWASTAVGLVLAALAVWAVGAIVIEPWTGGVGGFGP